MPEDRQRLIKAGEALNHRVHDVIGIVTVKTYRRWIREKVAGRATGRVGRPKLMTKWLRELILRMARENDGWGVRRIVGELRKLALGPSRSSVRRVLVDEGIMPDPARHAPKGVMTPWRKFVAVHMNSMVACNFFCKNVFTPLGKQMAYVLAFIHLESRKVFLSPSTYHPTGEWLQQQARSVAMWVDEEGIELRFVIHDHDCKFTDAFDEYFRWIGEAIVKTPYVAPIANCYCESWISSLKRECLNHFFCFSLRHLDHIAQTYARYHHEFRPHQSLGNVPSATIGQPPPPGVGRIRRERLLGGLLNHYYREAA